MKTPGRRLPTGGRPCSERSVTARRILLYFVKYDRPKLTMMLLADGMKSSSFFSV